MIYSLAQFHRLIEIVERSGGEYLEEICAARAYNLSGGVGTGRFVLPGCGTPSLFEVPYEVPVKGATNASVLQPITLCAICDCMGYMPRFAGAMH